MANQLDSPRFWGPYGFLQERMAYMEEILTELRHGRSAVLDCRPDFDTSVFTLHMEDTVKLEPPLTDELLIDAVRTLAGLPPTIKRDEIESYAEPHPLEI